MLLRLGLLWGCVSLALYAAWLGWRLDRVERRLMRQDYVLTAAIIALHEAGLISTLEPEDEPYV